MDTRIFHGNVTPQIIAQSLIANFSHEPYRTQQIGNQERIVVQITTDDQPSSGGQTALTVSLQNVADGVSVQLGKQSWLGIAASLGKTAFIAWRNPFELLGRLDDLAQDIENLQISNQVWEVIESTARAAGATFELSERLRRSECPYCHTANPVGEPHCIACGAPLGEIQPRTCLNCGFIIKVQEVVCPNCGNKL
ncbi:MAG TPA: zinc ribbon domain-containing protein [bacterium]